MVVNGQDLRVEVQLADLSWVAINDMNSFDKTSSRDSTRVPVFMRTTPYEVAGTRTQTYTMRGFINTDDPGQARLRSQEAANASVNIRVLFDGTMNGFSQSVKATSQTYGATPEGLQETGWDFTADADAVIIGAGPLM